MEPSKPEDQPSVSCLALDVSAPGTTQSLPPTFPCAPCTEATAGPPSQASLTTWTSHAVPAALIIPHSTPPTDRASPEAGEVTSESAHSSELYIELQDALDQPEALPEDQAYEIPSSQNTAFRVTDTEGPTGKRPLETYGEPASPVKRYQGCADLAGTSKLEDHRRNTLRESRTGTIDGTGVPCATDTGTTHEGESLMSTSQEISMSYGTVYGLALDGKRHIGTSDGTTGCPSVEGLCHVQGIGSEESQPTTRAAAYSGPPVLTYMGPVCIKDPVSSTTRMEESTQGLQRSAQVHQAQRSP